MDEYTTAKKIISILDAQPLPQGASARLMRSRYAALEKHREHLVQQGSLLMFKIGVPQFLMGLALIASIFIIQYDDSGYTHYQVGEFTQTDADDGTFDFLDQIGIELFGEDTEPSSDGI